MIAVWGTTALLVTFCILGVWMTQACLRGIGNANKIGNWRPIPVLAVFALIFAVLSGTMVFSIFEVWQTHGQYQDAGITSITSFESAGNDYRLYERDNGETCIGKRVDPPEMMEDVSCFNPGEEKG